MGILGRVLGNSQTMPIEEIQEKYGFLLINGEVIDIGFKLLRDLFIFTDKRLILIDVQGMTGKKKDFMSIPYRSMSRFSLETAGSMDLDAELKIWISSENMPTVSKKFNKAVNVYEVQRYLAGKVL